MENTITSPFFAEKYTRKFNVSLLAFERVWSLFTSQEGEATQESVSDAYVQVANELCGLSTPTQEDLDYLVSRVIEASKSAENKKANPSGSKRTFSSEFYKMVAQQPIYDLLYQMCQYNFEEVRYVYTMMDRDDALHMLDVYLLRIQHDQQILLESSVYGAGGSFGEGSKADVEVDLTTNSPSAISQLKSIF